MKRIDRKRLEAWMRVNEMGRILMGDLAIAAEHPEDEALEYITQEEIDREMAFWRKTSLRTLLGLVDGLGYAMRSTAAEMAGELGVEISDPGKLVEVRLRSLENLQLAARHYPSLFGVSFDLDLDDEGGQAFVALAAMRDEITQPGDFEQFTARNAHKHWAPGCAWILSRLRDLLVLCAQQVEGVEAPVQPFGGLLPPQPGGRRSETFSGPGDETDPSGSFHTLDSLKEALGILIGETSRAVALTNRLGRDSMLSPPGQFGLRTWVRTFLCEVETKIHMASLYISAAAERGEITLSDEDRESLGGKFVLDEKLVRVMTIWSREFGQQKPVQTGGMKWTAFRRALQCRHRITHPRSPADLRIPLDGIDMLVDADGWFREVTDLARLEAEDGAGKAR